MPILQNHATDRMSIAQANLLLTVSITSVLIAIN